MTTATRHDHASGRFYYIPQLQRDVTSFSEIASVISKGEALSSWMVNQERNLVYEAAQDHFFAIAGVTPPPKPSEYLDGLKKAVKGLRTLRNKKKEASDLGRAVHAYIEADLRGTTPAIPDGGACCIQAYQVFRHQYELTPIYQERVICSVTHEYAGTMDCYGMLDGVHTVLDWKTGAGIYYESLLQIACYVMALIEGGDAVAPVQGCIVRLPKIAKDEAKPQVRIVSWEEIQTLFPIFLAAKTIWESKREYESRKI
jgi:hypothetical protein